MNKLTLIFITLVLASNTQAQKGKLQDDPNWMNKDSKINKVAGVSSDKAYNTILKNKKSTTVIVAVIDGGTEIDHPDLKNNIWTNPKEIAGNGIDDDKNGYVDDINGWDFIGGKDGKDVQWDNYEFIRVIREYEYKYESLDDDSKLNDTEKKEYKNYQNAKVEFESKLLENDTSIINRYVGFLNGISEVQVDLGKNEPTIEELQAYKTDSPVKNIVAGILLNNKKKNINVEDAKKQLNDGINKTREHFKTVYEYQLNKNYDCRTIVGDNYNDGTDKYYGNNEVEGPDGGHGTHVAGIIGATRNNGIGMNGICENAKIMVLRVVPDGDERDKDVANAIRYAADNGAKVINMSFGKYFSYNKKIVDEAVKYAISKDVLLVHAAGNDGQNTEEKDHYPTPKYDDGGIASSWIEVGAVGQDFQPASFSNFGVTSVDVFSPGVRIYSSIPDYKYEYFDGTSMAAPACAGVAALIRSYYPNLTAEQVKNIILKSSIKYKKKVIQPGTVKKKVKYATLCKSGGIINAYKALIIANEIN